MKNNLLTCEEIPYREKVKMHWKGTSMLYAFLIWLKKLGDKKHGKK